MDDVISRQAAIRVASGYCHPSNIAQELANLPSEQTEIVRCKECRWRDDFGHWLGCPVLNVDDDNFCSMAERRTDG